MSLGFRAKSTSSVSLNLKNPPSTGFQMRSKPPFKVCFPIVFEMSSLNCHLRWTDCCGTLPLVPNDAFGKVTSGAETLVSIRLFQYCHPTVAWLTRVLESCEVKVRFATCRWLVVKLPSV